MNNCRLLVLCHMIQSGAGVLFISLLHITVNDDANLHDPRVTRTSRSSPPDSVGLVSGLDINNLLQDLMRWSGGVQSGHVSEQHVSVMFGRPVWTATSEFLT